MKRALKLAARGKFTTSPNPVVGCVIVRNGMIIGEGYHHKAGEPHAEIMAMRSAGASVAGATCYVTLEPCSHYGRTPPCAKALVKAGVKRVVIACGDPNPQVAGRGVKILKDAGIEVDVGLYENKALKLNRAFFKSIVKNIPYVTVKIGMSLDGKIALSDGRSKWITSDKSRKAVQKMRAESDAIITGAGTVLADNPMLNVRYDELPEKVFAKYDINRDKQPLRVVLDSHLRINPDNFAMFSQGKILLVRPSLNHKMEAEKLNEHVEIFYAPCEASGRICLSAVLSELSKRQCRKVLVEAGPTLVDAFLKENLADELAVFVAPKILGANAKSAFACDEVSSLDCLKPYKIKTLKKCGTDFFVRALLA